MRLRFLFIAHCISLFKVIFQNFHSYPLCKDSQIFVHSLDSSTPGAGVTGHLRKFSESVTVSHKVFGRGAGPASALLWRLSDTEPRDTDRGPLLIYTSAFLGRPILDTRERDTAMISSYRRAEYHFILTAKDGNTVRDELTPGFPEGRSSSNKF